MSGANPMPTLRALLDDHEQRYGRGDLWRAASEEMDRLENSKVSSWMRRKLQDASRVTRGESDACGHPHSWCGLVIPDWEWRQMMDVAEEEDR